MLSHEPLLNSGESGEGSWIGFLCDDLAAGTSGGCQDSALCLSLSRWFRLTADLAGPLFLGLL